MSIFNRTKKTSVDTEQVVALTTDQQTSTSAKHVVGALTADQIDAYINEQPFVVNAEDTTSRNQYGMPEITAQPETKAFKKKYASLPPLQE